MKVKIFQQVVSIGLTVWLIYMAYFETGVYTTIILSLMTITFKVQEFLNTKNTENMVTVAYLLEKITGAKS